MATELNVLDKINQILNLKLLNITIHILKVIYMVKKIYGLFWLKLKVMGTWEFIDYFLYKFLYYIKKLKIIC